MHVVKFYINQLGSEKENKQQKIFKCHKQIMDLLHSSFGDRQSNRVMNKHSDFPINSYNTFPYNFFGETQTKKRKYTYCKTKFLKFPLTLSVQRVYREN